MGVVVDGEWQSETFQSKGGGAFVRQEASFRDWVRADGSTVFKADADRYHLYVSVACPWSHRTTIFRALKGLESVVTMSIVDPLMLDNGWEFSDGPGCIPDTVNGLDRLYELYVMAKPNYTGRVTVPVLWDKRARTIVNNESADIIRMFNSEFDRLTEVDTDYYPAELRHEIDTLNDLIYASVNNGVYRCGFASTQQAYDRAFDELFATLEQLEARLERQRYLLGSMITETDWRLFVTLVRFDAVYGTHFKCNKRRLVDFRNLWSFTREFYQMPGIAETVNMDHIKRHYYGSHRWINPSRVVPKGPIIDFTLPHDRARLP